MKSSHSKDTKKNAPVAPGTSVASGTPAAPAAQAASAAPAPAVAKASPPAKTPPGPTAAAQPAENHEIAQRLERHADRLENSHDHEMAHFARVLSSVVSKSNDVNFAQLAENSFVNSLKNKYANVASPAGANKGKVMHKYGGAGGSGGSSGSVPSMTLIMDKSTYGFAEVDSAMSGGVAILPPTSAASPALWLVFHDFPATPTVNYIHFSGLPASMLPYNPVVTALDRMSVV